MTKAEAGNEPVERIGGYRVVRRLATGGTSDVLLARAEGPLGFERNVVLKLLLSQFRNDDEFARMFAREASAYARLSHPSIVRLFDFFALPASANSAGGTLDGQLVMVLEHVDGPALSRFRSQLKAIGKEVDDRTAIYIAMRVFDALAAAHATVDESGHSAPVIHRDVNPSNILLPFDGQVKLADFGVAKVTGLEHQSVAGMIKGTYGYMAPEQIVGDMVTPRADVYAGGIILWELLVKRRAFQRGALPEIEALRAMAEPRLPSIDSLRPDVDKAVRDALKRALEPRAERRMITAEEMVSVLSAIVRPEEGRQELVAVLGLVRSAAPASETGASRRETRANEAPSTLPNPDTKDVEEGAQRRASAGAAAPPPPTSSRPRGVLAKTSAQKITSPMGSSPRPPSVSRMTAVLGSAKPTRPTMPKVAPSPGPPPSPRSFGTTAPLGSSGPKLPSSPKLFAATVSTKETSAPESNRAEGPPPPPLARPRTTSSARQFAASVKIDEVLREVPSSMPPSILDESSKGHQVEVIPPIGAIPAAPSPMASDRGNANTNAKASGTDEDGPNTVVMNPADTAPPTPRMFPVGQRTLVLESTSVDATRPPTAPPVAPPERPPYAHGQAPPPPASSEQTVVTSPPVPPSGPEPDPVPRGARVGVVAVSIMLLVGAGTVGTVGYLRYKRAHTTRPLISIPVVPSTSVPVVPSIPAVTAPSSSSPVQAATAPDVRAAASSPVASATGPAASVRPTESVAPSAERGPPIAKSAPSPARAGEIAEGMGTLKTTGSAPGRRIFVDEKTLGQTPENVTVKCGKHAVRLGSSGKSQAIDVPCGGEITVGDKL